MTDPDTLLRDELDRLTSPVPPPDWDDVLRRAVGPAPAARRRAAFGALTIAAAALLWVATPLGATVANGIGGFSSWLTGEPGSPAPKAEQQAFAHANTRSWDGFPAGTKLRQLARVTAGGKVVDLLGFRSGDTLCLRVVVTGAQASQACAPLAALREAGAPVRVVLVDQPFGKGTNTAWYGLDRERAPALQVTAGIAADGVHGVTLHDEAGSHTAHVVSNAFLYVAVSPRVGQRVDRIEALTAGYSIRVPFAPATFGLPFGGLRPSGHLPGPSSVQRHVSGGTIGWLVQHRAVGLPLSVLPARTRGEVENHAVFGRIVTPDPGLPYRVVVTLNTSPGGTKPIGVCTWVITGPHSGAGGGCQRGAELFAAGPIAGGTGWFNGSDEYSSFVGLVSDDVAKMTAFLANGQTEQVALNDNAYFVQLPRNAFPVRLVAYDRQGRIIGLISELGVNMLGTEPARGRPRLVASSTAAGGRFVEVYVGPATGVGTCTYVKWHESSFQGGRTEGCSAAAQAASNKRLLLIGMGRPSFMLAGPTPPETAEIRLHYADGATSVRPVAGGYVAYEVPAAHLTTAHELASVAALDRTGKVLATESIPIRH